MTRLSLLILPLLIACGPQYPTRAESTPAASNPPELTVSQLVSVYDGDTFTVDLTCPYPLFCNEIPIRVLGIDTPEIRGGTEITKMVTRQARDFTDAFLRTGEIQLSELGRDKFFRIDASVSVNGVDLASELIKTGLAVAYNGEGTKPDWVGILASRS